MGLFRKAKETFAKGKELVKEKKSKIDLQRQVFAEKRARRLEKKAAFETKLAARQERARKASAAIAKARSSRTTKDGPLLNIGLRKPGGPFAQSSDRKTDNVVLSSGGVFASPSKKQKRMF